MASIEDHPKVNAAAAAADETAAKSDHRGVKDDLSDLKNTLTRQFWGVASFLAPPPNPPNPDPAGDEVAGADGMRGDLAEIGDKVRSGISKISDNIKVSDFAKIASNFLQLEPEEDGDDSFGGAVGVTDDVVAFARDVSVHPETWLNFPLPDDDDVEDDEFELSDAQQEHALAVERLAPGLADLRFALCPGYMSESCFWKIYFVLLHPKLDKNDAVVLSTPQILKARAFLTAELRNRPKPKPDQNSPENNTPINEIPVPSQAPPEPMPLDKPATGPVSSTVDTDIEIEKHPIQSTQIPIIDKSVVDQAPAGSVKDQSSDSSSFSKVSVEKDDDDGDAWLKEEGAELANAVKSTIHIQDDEDVSFSDLEED